MFFRTRLYVILSAFILSTTMLATDALSNSEPCVNRREWAKNSLTVGASSALLLGGSPSEAQAASLAAKLAKRDPNALSNSVFNVPPGVQVYPEFLRGTWDIDCRFGGYLFPSTKIPKERLISNYQVPGFQKCSIAATCDVGKDSRWTMTIDTSTGWEDRVSTLTSQIDSNLGYSSIAEILYNPKSNPNRLSIDFVEYKTKNAERIELFCNARESEYVPETGVFVCSEYIRQVTFGTGSQVGVPRQVVGNYAHFWTWRQKNPGDPSTISGNLLTAAYLDPQDSLFFEEPSKPVVVYSHILNGVRKD